MRPLVVVVAPVIGSAVRRAEFRGLAAGAPHLARVVYVGSRTGARVALNRILCAWFAACTRRSTLVRQHPVLGEVPICADCDAKVARLGGGGAS